MARQIQIGTEEAEGPQAPLRLPAHFEREFPGADRSATEAAINIVRAAALVLAELDRRRRTVADLGASAAQTLAVIEGAGRPLAPHEIMDRLLVTSGTMTSILDTLERRGLVRRAPHPEDRRKLLIDITDEAKAILDAMLPVIRVAERDALAGVSPEDREHLVRILGQIQAHLERLKEEPVPPPDVIRTEVRGS